MTLDDKYTYPGSGGVLVNRLGIRDLGRLDHALNDYASVAWVQLRQMPPPEPPGFGYLQTIHREMFGSLLDWAGELRETDVQATGTGIAYARPEYISESLQSLFRKLEREDFLSGLDSPAFTDRLADRWGELSTGGSALLGCELYAYDLPPLDRARNGDRGVRPRRDHRIRGASAKASSSIERSP